MLTHSLASSSNSRSIIADRANNEDLLTSEELFDLFARVQNLVDECLVVITQNSPAIAMTMLEVGSEMIAKLHRNKTLCKRKITYTHDYELKDEVVDPKVKERDQNAFICDCFDLGRDLVAGKDVSRHVESMRLSRMFAERFIRAWLHQLQGYEAHSWAAAKSYTGTFNDDFVAAHAALNLGFRRTSLDPDIGLGIVRFVRARVESIDAIYTRITTAYMRVILKVAKANALPGNDEHFLELYQFGYFGIARANTSYDYVLQAKYVAVAKWWVRQQILFNMKASSGMIKISPSIWQHRARMDKVRYKIISRQGYCTDEDIAKELGFTAKYVANIYEHVRAATVGLYEPGTYETEVEADTETPEALLSEAVSVISTLPLTERTYLSLLYDLGSVEQDIPQEEIEWQRLRQRTAKIMTVDA